MRFVSLLKNELTNVNVGYCFVRGQAIKKPGIMPGFDVDVKWGLAALNRQSHAHATANTQCGQAFFGIATLHFV